MDNNIKKCSLKKHKDTLAISYCHECKLFMCHKCLNHHAELFESHNQYNLDKDIQEIFIDICQEEKHPNKFEFYCKDHSILCCAACISKLEGKGYGQHKDRNVCFIENIKEEKKKKLNENIEYLENLSNVLLEKSINELKAIFEKIDKSKEEIKSKIQNVFTKIRTVLNEREDELLFEVDNQYNEKYCSEDIIKEIEKLPNKVKKLIEKGKLIDKKWNYIDNDKLSSLINDCLIIENNVNRINILNESIKKYNTHNKLNIKFTSDEYLDNFIKTIKIFGNISNFNSIILKNKEDLEKFENLISNEITINNIELIYRASKDTAKYQNVVNKVNNKSNLIFLFLTGNQRIFGAYIKTKLENIQEDKYYRDENAFVFSLNNNKIYKIVDRQSAIHFCERYSILIGNIHNYNGFYLDNSQTTVT